MEVEKKCLEELIGYFNKIKSYTIFEIDENIQEMELNVSSDNFYKSMLNNLLYYYKQSKMDNKTSDEQKYFISTIVDILNIIYTNKANIFFLR